MSKSPVTLRNPKEKFKSKIGGQAVIEGIMMKGPEKAVLACRLPSGKIDVEDWAVKKGAWYKKCPFLRGSVVFVSSLIEGYKCLNKSAQKQGEGIDEELTPFEEKLVKLFGDKLMTVVAAVAMVVGVAISVGLFMFLPALVTGLISEALPSPILKTLIEGVLKIGLFVGYLWLVSRMKDIQRTFEYHGAEHKTIACYEAKLPLTTENIRAQSRFHPRCGTSFLVLTLIVSIVVFSMVTWDTIWMRLLLKIVLLPVVCGISYELIRLAGQYDNIFTKILSAPGIYLQRLTTREPDDSQIEVAIAAMTPCIPDGGEE